MARPRGARDRKPRKKQVWGVWYEGRRTAIVRSASSRAEAIRITRPEMRRGGKRVVSARPLKGTSLKQAQAGRWVRERARPGDETRLRGFGPKPKGFDAADSRSLVTFGDTAMMLGDAAEFAQNGNRRKRRAAMAVGGVATAGVLAGGGYLAVKGRGVSKLVNAAAKAPQSRIPAALPGPPPRPAPVIVTPASPMPPVKPLSNADKAKQMMLGDLREKAVRQNAIRGGQLGFVKAYTRSDGTVVRGYNKARALAWAAGTTLGRATAVAKRGAEIAVDQTAKGLKRDEVGRKVFGDVVAKSGKLMQEGSAREAKVKRQLGKWVKRVTTKDATPGSGITRKVRRNRR